MSNGWIEVYRDAKGEWRWRKIGKNGSDIIAEGGEGYARRVDMLEIVADEYPGVDIVEEDGSVAGQISLDDDYEGER